MTMTEATSGFAPYNALTGEPLRLVMQELNLCGKVLPVGARLHVQHVFRSQEDDPVEVIYAFGLPRDAALRSFRIMGEGFDVRSELQPVKEAKHAYEKAIDEGHLASLATQYQDGVVNLSVGNVQPGENVIVQLEIVAGVDVRDDGFRFRFPFTLAPTYHREARVGVDERGHGVIELPDSFDDLILPAWVKDAKRLHAVNFDLDIDCGASPAEVSSPSHVLRVQPTDGGAKVGLAVASDLPDRDLVLDVRTAEVKETAYAGIDDSGAGRFTAVVPSTCFGVADSEAPRRIVFLLDHSGSMCGAPLAQAKRALEACLGALTEQDEFSIVAFESRSTAMSQTPIPATREGRSRAAAFLKGINPAGGTELEPAVHAASAVLGGEGGDIIVITDGQVSETGTIVAAARATGARISCLGIGSASQDRFLTLLARETGGVSRFQTPRERVDMAALELFAGIGRPLASGVKLRANGREVSILVTPAQTVFAGSPLIVMGFSAKAKECGISFDWTTSAGERKCLELAVPFTPNGLGDTVKLLQGARLITDAESETPTAEKDSRLLERHENRMNRRFEALSREYGLASRAMALVAVVTRPGDARGKLPATKVVPVGMPQDTAFSGYFNAMPFVGGSQKVSCMLSTVHCETAPTRFMRARRGFVPPSVLYEMADFDGPADSAAGSGPPDAFEDPLFVHLAAMLQPDGSYDMPDDESKVAAGLVVLLALREEGHTLSGGPFRLHVRRILAHLRGKDLLNSLPSERAETLKAVVTAYHDGRALAGPWTALARQVEQPSAFDAVAAWEFLELAVS